MKRIILPLTLFLCVSIFSSAQKIGIKAGGNFTNIVGKSGTGDKLSGHQYIPGFHVGALGEIDLAEVVSVQIEAVYSQKGFRDHSSVTIPLSFGNSTTESNVVYKFSYVDVPLLLNIHFGQMGSYIGLGPQVSFLTGVKYDGLLTVTTTTTTTTPPKSSTAEFENAGKDKTGYSKTDFGVVIGTGSKWDSGIEYCLRAGYGLANVVDQSSSTSNEKWNNLVFSVSIGYTFGAGGGGQGDRYGRKYNSKSKHH